MGDVIAELRADLARMLEGRGGPTPERVRQLIDVAEAARTYAIEDRADDYWELRAALARLEGK